jgi:DNA mismatch repair protein MutS
VILENMQVSQAGQGDLFAAPPASEPGVTPLEERLAEVSPDSLSPREALDILYELKTLMDHA